MVVLRTLVLAAVGSFALLSIGHAASANVSGGAIGMGRLSVARCTTAGLTVVPNLSVLNVVSVAVGSLPAACGNATLQVTVVAGAASGSGSATIPAAGGSVMVTLSPAVAAAASERIDLVVLGP